MDIQHEDDKVLHQAAIEEVAKEAGIFKWVKIPVSIDESDWVNAYSSFVFDEGVVSATAIEGGCSLQLPSIGKFALCGTKLSFDAIVFEDSFDLYITVGPPDSAGSGCGVELNKSDGVFYLLSSFVGNSITSGDLGDVTGKHNVSSKILWNFGCVFLDDEIKSIGVSKPQGQIDDIVILNMYLSSVAGANAISIDLNTLSLEVLVPN